MTSSDEEEVCLTPNGMMARLVNEAGLPVRAEFLEGAVVLRVVLPLDGEMNGLVTRTGSVVYRALAVRINDYGMNEYQLERPVTSAKSRRFVGRNSALRLIHQPQMSWEEAA